MVQWPSRRPAGCRHDSMPGLDGRVCRSFSTLVKTCPVVSMSVPLLEVAGSALLRSHLNQSSACTTQQGWDELGAAAEMGANAKFFDSATETRTA